jgi:hypothetical protein
MRVEREILDDELTLGSAGRLGMDPTVLVPEKEHLPRLQPNQAADVLWANFPGRQASSFKFEALELSITLGDFSAVGDLDTRLHPFFALFHTFSHFGLLSHFAKILFS